MTLTMASILADVQEALEEDLGSGDVSAALLADDLQAEAELISREPMLLCGQPWVEATLKSIDKALKINWAYPEGQWLAAPTSLARLEGPAKSLLSAERTCLNFLQTLSGTATETYHYLQQLAGTATKLLDTRKTLPKLRQAQKYAVALAGGTNHRFGLYDAFLIKENHIKAAGSIQEAVTRARAFRPALFLEVEVENLSELEEALLAKPERILLDNFPLSLLKQAVSLAKPYAIPLEASGNVSLTTIRQIAQTGVAYISVGNLTKSVKAIDLSLLIRTVK